MKEKEVSNIWFGIYTLIFLVLVGIDQFTKYLATMHLKDQAPYVVMEGVFELRYLENRGAAFGMMQGQYMLFYVLTVIMTIFILWEIKRLFKNPKYRPFVLTLLLVLSGAIGNFIDRISLQYVVDFFYFKLIDFAIFNMADSYITIAVILFILLVLFYYKEEDLDYMIPSFKRKKKD